MRECAQRDAYLDGGLAGSAATAFEAHLSSCEACQRAVTSWRQFSSELQQATAVWRAPAPPGAVTRLLARAEAPPRSPRWVWGVVAVAAALAVTVAVWRGRSAATDVPVATTLMAATSASVNGGVWETAEEGRAVVQLGDDVVGVGPGSRVVVASATRRATRLELQRGVVAASVDHRSGPRDFEVQTPHGVVHVVGTVFRVTSSAASLEVAVARGTVEVRRPSGDVERVKAGAALRLEAGKVTTSSWAEPSFDELSASPAPRVAPAVDAGVDEAVSEPAPPPTKPQPVKSERVAEWRSRAAKGDCAGVVREVEAVVKQGRADAEAYLVLGDCRRSGGQPQAAVTAYRQAAKSKGRSGARGLLLAASLLQDELGDAKGAIGLLDSYLAKKPETPGLEAAARVRKARAQATLGQKAAARAGLEDVLRRFPDTPAAAEAVRVRDSL